MLRMREASVFMSGKPNLYRICILTALMALSAVGSAWSADGRIVPQSVSDSYFNEWGLYTGAGYGRVAEGPYVPIFLILHLGVDAKRWLPLIREHRGTLTVFIEPQFNPSGTPKQNAEIGLGIGLKYSYPVNETISMYALGSVGPHYMTLDTADQAQGFLFADTIGAGMSVFISRGSAINVEYRFRHLSNAGIKSPNLGVNSNIVLIGFTLFY